MVIRIQLCHMAIRAVFQVMLPDTAVIFAGVPVSGSQFLSFFSFSYSSSEPGGGMYLFIKKSLCLCVLHRLFHFGRLNEYLTIV